MVVWFLLFIVVRFLVVVMNLLRLLFDYGVLLMFICIWLFMLLLFTACCVCWFGCIEFIVNVCECLS